MSLPSIRQLQYFVALEKHRHFGRAARECHVSQPAFSIAIRELESTLDLQLVDRTNKAVTITGTGREVAVQARLVLRDLEQLVELAASDRDPLRGTLKMGVIPTIAPFLLPELLPRLRRSFPDLRLVLQEGLTLDIHQRLLTGELDFLLAALPFELRNTDCMTLFPDGFRLAYHRNTRLLDPDDYSIDTLPAESVILLEDGHCLRDHALSACRVRNLDKISPIGATSMLTLVQMVDADLGVSYVPELSLKSPLFAKTRVRTLPLPGDPHRDIALIWRRGSNRVREFRLLGEFIRGQR